MRIYKVEFYTRDPATERVQNDSFFFYLPASDLEEAAQKAYAELNTGQDICSARVLERDAPRVIRILYDFKNL